MKLSVAILTLALFGTAPFQCASDPDPNRRIEDTPAEALWTLSERFRSEGNDAARRTTLQQLVDQYPNSREAERARLVLEGREVESDHPAAEPSDPPAEQNAGAPAETPSES
jgi:hypothetical protein